MYQQVVEALRAEVLRGKYPVGTQLPTEGELSDQFSVSRHTIRAALRQLRDDGLVSSRQGSGTTVTQSAAPKSYVHEVASINDLIQYAAQIRYDVKQSGLVSIDAVTAGLTGTPVGSSWLRVEGLRYGDDSAKPVCFTEVFVDADFAGVARLIGRRPGAIYELIEDLYAVRVERVDQTLKAVPVPAELAPELQVEEGATVIEVIRTYRIGSGRVVEVARNLYAAEGFSLALTLRRARG